MPVRNRANIVCTECHSRKVKCDLQSSSDGVCKNCRRAHQICIRRDGLRKRRPRRRLQDGGAHREGQTQRPVGAELPIQDHGNAAASLPQQCNNFLSHCAAIPSRDVPEMAASKSTTPESPRLRDTILESMRASILPKPGLVRAWADAYMTHAFHYCPVAEQRDFSGSHCSVLLQHGICLVGNLTRHDSSGPKLAEEFYEKIKILISINYEHDQVRTLQTLCLVTCWHGNSSDPVSLDGPWHWIGVALRLMLQLGLHRESTYAGRHDAGCLRRIFWQLQNSDSLQVVTWGRPPLLRRKDFDVRLPTLEDFETPTFQAFIFLENTKLCVIISSISDLHSERRPIQSEELVSVEAALCDWVGQLPGQLQLYDETGQRNTYCRPVSEIFIQYFVTIIMSEMLKDRDRERPWRVSVLSLVAASCAAALYDEIHCRDDTVFLPSIHGFFCLAVALPLFHYVPQSAAKESARTRDLGIVRSIIIGMRDRYGDWDMVLGKMNGLERSIERQTGRGQRGENTLFGAQEPCLRANELLPFPPTFCDNMDMLELAIIPACQFVAENFATVSNYPTDEAVFDFTLMDLFDLDLGSSNIVFENEDHELGMSE